MKDLLSKEHYCSKIHILLMKKVFTPPPVDNPLYDLPIFTKNFQKSQPTIKEGGVDTMTLFTKLSHKTMKMN